MTYSVHYVLPRASDDDWLGVALGTPDGDALLLCDAEDAASVMEALRAFVENGVAGEPMFDNDERLGVSWLSTSQMVDEAHAYDPSRYPLSSDGDRRRLMDRLGSALRSGRITAAEQTSGGRWKASELAFRGWLARNSRGK